MSTEGGWGMAHGRFQPLHNGHLAYLRAAAGRCERLLVGITNPDRRTRRPEPAEPARHLPAANPFTYLERLLMVEGAARDAGLRVHVVPFPVSEPELWPDYVPGGAEHFLRVFSPWGEEKLARLRAAGHRVTGLDPGAAKEVSGSEVRARLARGDEVGDLVPPAVARVLAELPVPAAARLRALAVAGA